MAFENGSQFSAYKGLLEQQKMNIVSQFCERNQLNLNPAAVSGWPMKQVEFIVEFKQSLLGKSRVVPNNFISIPRLELDAAVLLVKIKSLLKKELNCAEMKERFLTENKVVKGYIKNYARRFKAFLTN